MHTAYLYYSTVYYDLRQVQTQNLMKSKSQTKEIWFLDSLGCIEADISIWAYQQAS